LTAGTIVDAERYGPGRRTLAKMVQVREAGTIMALVVLCLALVLSTNTFLRPTNVFNVLRQMSETSIIAVGMTMLIITGEFDLSVGSMFGLSAVTIGVLVRDLGWNIWLAFGAALLLGALVGLANGLLTTKIRIPSFIVTLGTMGILRGGALVLANGYPISEFPDSSFFSVFSGRLFSSVPAQVVWMLAVNVVGAIVLARFVFGYHLYATGSNRRATMLSGVDTDRIKISAFVITSVLAAFSGAIMVAHLGSATPLAGQGNELDVIAAVVIGGTALTGGSGTVFGSFLGAAIMAVLRDGLVLLGISSYYQVAAIGFVIIAAVVIDTLTNRRSSIRR
jgi:ribose/xylose/arabinose/galactoside ABC-type transport system permease subunit